MNIRKLVRPNIRELKAYQAEDIPNRIKLDANESPYGFRVLKSVRTNRYPDPEAKALRRFMAKEYKVRPEHVLHGNGSDELIYNLITTFGGPVLYPVPTFSMYGIIARALGEEKKEVPLDNEFDIDPDKFLKAVRTHKPKLIFLSSPNNPTGNCFSSDRILNIIKKSGGLVVVDEAYQPFSGKDEFLPLIEKYRNLVVLRTLSKIGLAGLRVGFMLANEDIVKEVNKVRLPFNLNSLSQTLALDILKNRKQMRSYIRSIVSERRRLLKEMLHMNNVKPCPSDANFILFKVPGSDNVYTSLLKKGILVRNMKGISEGCLRVTVGTPGENDAFLKALKIIL